MRRRLAVVCGLLGVVASGLPAAAQSEGDASEQAEEGALSVASVQEIGVRVGMAAGGRVTPGGLHLGGIYLYQLSDTDWFDGGLGFTFGGGGAACFRDREDRFLCDHGLVDGFSGEASAGVRRWMRSQGRFVPYLRAGLALGVGVFNRDEVRGLSLPAWIGGGVRARVSDGVYVAGGAVVKAGIGWFNQGLGLEPYAALLMTVGVDFGLD